MTSALPKITMTLLVRNEEDIIEDNLWFHHEHGVDSFLITDNLSTDRTAEIIKSLARELDIEYIYQPEDDYSQHKWVTEMAQRASRHHGADWVINNDADEFWSCEQGSLKSYLSAIPPDIGALNLKRYNAVVLADKSDILRASSHPSKSNVFEAQSVNSSGQPLPGKCMHRASDTVRVHQGNHGVKGVEGKIMDAESGFKILHFPHRTFELYTQKITLGGAAYARNKELPTGVGKTWRDQYKKLKSDGLESEWRGLAQSRQDIFIGLATQTLFQDDTVVNALKTRKRQRAEKKISEALESVCQESQSAAKKLARNMGNHITRVRKERRVTRPLYYNLEYCTAGPQQQIEDLAELQKSGNFLDLHKSFASLRDSFSLFPQNEKLKDFFGDLLRLSSPEATERLRADCQNKVVVLHTCCVPKIAHAEESIASFDECGNDYHHIILVGEAKFQKEEEVELSLKYDGKMLTVPVPDNYESLHRKVFYALMLLDLVADPSFVVKLDDDLVLTNATAFTKLMDRMASADIDYAGRVVGSASHKEQWHGWHVSKCEDGQINKRGHQYPLPKKYAAGGYGYILGRRGLTACSYMYLAMKEFFAMRTVGLEDAYVGHAMFAQGIAPHDISFGRHILAMPGIKVRHRLPDD